MSKKEKIEKVEEQTIQAPVTINPTQMFIDKLPEIVTPKELTMAFNMNDGGKYVRRHIRKHFVEGGIRKQTETTTAKYAWKHDDPQLIEMVTYFLNLFKPATKNEVKA